MLTLRLLLATVFTVAYAAIGIRIGTRLLQHKPPGAAGRATTRFGIWWIGFGADAVINQVTWDLGALGLASPPVAAILTYLALATVAVMLWGIASYIAFLFTGREGALSWATVFYVAQFVLGLAFIVSLNPVGVRSTLWGGAIEYVRQPTGPIPVLFAAFFLLPPIVAAISLATLIPRARDSTHRYRLSVVSLGVLIWFAASLVITGTGASGDAAEVVGLLIGLGSMLVIRSAYLPPAFLRARGIQPFGAGDRTHEIDRNAPPTQGREALMARVRELV